ncbi:MAG TPA: hypothetical protein VGS19_15120 [Streptosporangiaceae bacterium]|nr:hypothetical protein [Streptosporangiaceae bacterium]
MPRDEVASLRAANVRLREVIEAKDVEVSVLREQRRDKKIEHAGRLAARRPACP